MPSQLNRRNLTRRKFLKLMGASGAGLFLAACAPTATPAPPTAEPAAPPTEAPAGFDWMKYSGKSIRLVDLELFDEQLTRDLLDRFTQETGIEVIYERLEQSQARQKVATELTSGSGDLDAYFVTLLQDGAQYSKNGWFEPLTPFINDPSLTSPDYDFGDFATSVVDANTVDGQLIAVPILLDSQVLFYNRDLFDAGDVAVPTTLDELEQAAAALHDPDNNIYGIVSRGQASSAVSMFAGFLHNFGGDWFTDGMPSLNTPEAVAAYEYYGALLRNYGPPGVVNIGAGDLDGIFGAGLAAMVPDGASWMPTWQSEGEAVRGKVGTAKFPAGPARDAPTIYAYGVAMSSQSDDKEAAWYLLQWLTSKEVALELQVAGIGAGRDSAWTDPEFLNNSEEDWAEANQIAFASGDPNWAPPVVSIPEARDIAGAPIVVAIEGGDVQAAADTANEQLIELAKRDGVIS